MRQRLICHAIADPSAMKISDAATLKGPPGTREYRGSMKKKSTTSAPPTAAAMPAPKPATQATMMTATKWKAKGAVAARTGSTMARAIVAAATSAIATV